MGIAASPGSVSPCVAQLLRLPEDQFQWKARCLRSETVTDAINSTTCERLMSPKRLLACGLSAVIRLTTMSSKSQAPINLAHSHHVEPLHFGFLHLPSSVCVFMQVFWGWGLTSSLRELVVHDWSSWLVFFYCRHEDLGTRIFLGRSPIELMFKHIEDVDQRGCWPMRMSINSWWCW